MVAVFAVAGARVAITVGYGGIWDLDREYTLPAAFSALLLVAAAIAALEVGRQRVYGIHRGAYLLAALFFFMGLDEVFSFHERLESATAVDWETLYAPLIFVCGIAWLLVVRALRSFRLAQVVMALGGAAWLVAQILEKIQWDGDVKVDGYLALMFAEEILEMTGSALFLIALYWVLFREGGGIPFELSWFRRRDYGDAAVMKRDE